MNCLIKILNEAVEHYRDKTAIIEDKKAVTYLQFKKYYDRLADIFRQKLGENIGTVFMHMNNSISSLASFYALKKLECCPAILDRTFPIHSLKDAMKTCMSSIILFDHDELNIMNSILDSYTVINTNTLSGICVGFINGFKSCTKFNGFIRSTTGSTGKPKFCIFSDQALINVSSRWNKKFKANQKSVILCLSAFSTGPACSGALLNTFMNGATLVIRRGICTPKYVLNSLIENQVTHILAYPYMYNMLSNNMNGLKFPKIEILSSGSPLPRNLLDDFKNKTNVVIKDFYGLTETGICTYPDMDDYEGVGGILENVEIEFDENNVICIKTNSMPYLICSEEGITTLSVNKRGFYVTADVGHLNLKGELIIEGRKDANFVNMNGKKLNINEIRSKIVKYIPDQEIVIKNYMVNGKDKLFCFIEKNEVDVNELRKKLSRELAAFKIPQFVFLNQSARTSLGKLRENELYDLACNHY